MSNVLVELVKPIWGGGIRSIGVAEFRVQGFDTVEVEFTYTRKDGIKSFPDHYKMRVSKLLTYPTQTVGGGVKLYVSPMSDWEIVQKEVKREAEIIEPEKQIQIDLSEEYNNKIWR